MSLLSLQIKQFTAIYGYDFLYANFELVGNFAIVFFQFSRDVLFIFYHDNIRLQIFKVENRHLKKFDVS